MPPAGRAPAAPGPPAWSYELRRHSPLDQRAVTTRARASGRRRARPPRGEILNPSRSYPRATARYRIHARERTRRNRLQAAAATDDRRSSVAAPGSRLLPRRVGRHISEALRPSEPDLLNPSISPSRARLRAIERPPGARVGIAARSVGTVVYGLLGSDYDDSPCTQAGERVSRLAITGIRLVIDEFRSDSPRSARTTLLASCENRLRRPHQPARGRPSTASGAGGCVDGAGGERASRHLAVPLERHLGALRGDGDQGRAGPFKVIALARRPGTRPPRLRLLLQRRVGGVG
jgi:hypothetical protein